MNHIIYRKNITYIQEQTIDNIYNQFIFTYPFTWLDMTSFCLFVKSAWINCSVKVVTIISQNKPLVRDYFGFISIFPGNIVLIHYDYKVRLYLRWFVGLMTYFRYLCYLRIMVSNIYCVVFLLCLSSSCVLYTQCCQFLWIVHVWLPLRYYLTFIYNGIKSLWL